MKLDRAQFTIFDVETTGLYPYSGDRICEIAAARISPDSNRLKKFQSLVNPLRPMSYGAFSVNGITDDMVKDKPTIDQVLPHFLKFIKGSVLVAYNAGFDLGFVESALGKNRDLLADYLVVDALTLARKLFRNAGRYNLGMLSESLGIKSDEEHRAMADVVMTVKVFKKELKLLSAEGVKNVEDIIYARSRANAPVKRVKDYKLKLIEDAIREERKLNITYKSAWSNVVTNRVVTPVQIQKGYDKSYLVAYCHMKNEERNFRVDCITEINLIE
ncbi:MAG: exonuclease domain-containing protein [Candidatus Omnitrophota bacterium]|jgi:DNA polymerase-3 subunit alpha (Gram-positive type)